MNYKNLNLEPADRIVVPKSLIGLIQHHAIFLGKNEQGNDLIAENKIGFGVIIVTAEAFFKDVTKVTRIIKFNGSKYQRKIAVQNALSKAGQPYDLIDYNCEHFANDVQYGKAESDQADTARSLLKIAAGILLLFTVINSFTND